MTSTTFAVGNRVLCIEPDNNFSDCLGTVTRTGYGLCDVYFDTPGKRSGWGKNFREWCVYNEHLRLISAETTKETNVNSLSIQLKDKHNKINGKGLNAEPSMHAKNGAFVSIQGEAGHLSEEDTRALRDMLNEILEEPKMPAAKPIAAEATFQEALDFVANKWPHAVRVGMELAKNTVDLNNPATPSSKLVAVAIRQGLWKPPAPAVNPDDWDCKVAPELFTVAHFLATNYPHLLDKSNDIGIKMARQYKGAVIHVAASLAELKNNPHVTQVRAYPNNEANRRLLLQIIDP